MFERTRSYIIYYYFKYILIILLLFLGLIWLSQIIRIIELQYSISFQILDVAITTLLALPSYINPLIPFLILIGSMMLNNKIKSSNEIIIFKQYLSINKFKKIFQVLFFFTLSAFIFNNEILSCKLYEKYKIKELEIRNNLKLGSPVNNELHIDDILSIFFDQKDNYAFYGVETIIYNENQFISSEMVEIELSKSKFNLVFTNGEKLILNNEEKSKTIFDKFIYTLENKKYEELLLDKEHFNTIELILHSDKDFRNHGHNKIYQYFFLIIVCIISLKIIFFYINKKNNSLYFSIIFFLIFTTQIINSYLVYLLDNNEDFNLIYYYILSFLILAIAFYNSSKILK